MAPLFVICVVSMCCFPWNWLKVTDQSVHIDHWFFHQSSERTHTSWSTSVYLHLWFHTSVSACVWRQSVWSGTCCGSVIFPYVGSKINLVWSTFFRIHWTLGWNVYSTSSKHSYVEYTFLLCLVQGHRLNQRAIC